MIMDILGKFPYCIMKCVYSLELPQWGNSNEYNQHTIIIQKIKKIEVYPFAS